jgi:hypothetical protein
VCCRRDGCAVRRKISTQNNASDSALVSNHQRGSPSMNTRDDDLRVRLGRIRNRGSHYKGFFAEVRSAARHEGYRSRSSRVSRPSPTYFGRGRKRRLAATIRAWYAGGPSRHAGLLNSTRRVIVQARIVRHRGPQSAALSAHVCYLKRDGVTRTGETARMFTRETGLADERAFAERCRDDRHHFRFIVSPDDAAEMTDLRAFGAGARRRHGARSQHQARLDCG